MASLALIAGLIFLVVLISGPFVFFLSKLPFIPKLITNIIALLVIALGIWWLLLPISVVRYLGIITILFAYFSLKK